LNKLLYIDIYQEIEQKIISGELYEGERLLSERELASHYKVSRNVIREAIKVLKEKDYIEVKIGKGAYVKKPSVSIVADSLKRLINIELDGISKILEVREMLEVAIISKVVESAQECHGKKLEALYNEMERNVTNVDKFVEIDASFHLELAKSLSNDVFYILSKSFSDLSNKVIYLTKYNPASIVIAQQQHFKLIEAIKKRNQEMAISVMKEHIQAAQQDLNLIKNQQVKL